MSTNLKRPLGRLAALAVVLATAGACSSGASPSVAAPSPAASSAAPSAAASPAAPSMAASPSSNASADSVKIALDLANKATAGQSAQYEGTSGKTIGFVAAQLSNDGFRAEYVGFLQGAIQANMSVITLDAENDATKQLNMVQDLITRKVDAIVFTPVDSAAGSAAVVAANTAKIPVVELDRSTEGGQVVGVVTSDDVAIGKTGADLLADAAKQASIPLANLQVFDLMGDQSTSAGVSRYDGFSKEAQTLGLTVVAGTDAKWDTAKGNAAVLDAFQAHPGINAIYMASGCAYYPGVASALTSLNKLIKIGQPGHVIVIASDGCPADVQAVRDGYADGDAAHRILEMGQKAAEYAVAAINQQPIAQPKLQLAPDPITPANVEDPTHWANVVAVAK